MDARAPFDPLVTVPDPRLARELCDLLARAGIEARATRIDGAARLPGVEPEFVPASYTVFVPADELPVAAGVAERLLPWFGQREDGDASDADCIAALDEPHERDFAERLTREREWRGRWERLGRPALAAALLVAVALVAAAIVRVLLA